MPSITEFTLQEEAAVHHPFLKVWDLQNTEKKTGAPVLLRSVKVQSGNRPHPVSIDILCSLRPCG